MTIQNGQVANATEVLKAIGNPAAQLSYEQVKAGSASWTNTGYVGADNFLVGSGVKNTINIGSTTAIYESILDKAYRLNSTGTAEQTLVDSFSGTMANWTAGSSIAVGCTAREFNQTDYAGYMYSTCTAPDEQDRDVNTTATYNVTTADFLDKTIVVELDYTVNKGDAFHSADVNIILGGVTLWSVSTTSSGTGAKVKIEPFTSNSVKVYLDTGGGYSLVGTVDISAINSKYALLFKCHANVSSSSGSGSSTATMKINNLWIDNYDTSSIVETKTILNEVVPKSIVVYGKKLTPSGTNILINASDDGGLNFPLTGYSINTSIDTSSFTIGSLALQFNLTTNNGSVTPKLYGYGVAIVDS